MAPPKEPTSGWPSTEYDPETVYDTWTWKLPPWLEIAPSADGFIHFPIDQGGPPWPEEQLFLPRNTAMKHLVPPIAFWLDLVNSKPHALTGFALRVLNEATGEVLKVHPGDMWAMLMAEYRDNTWITLIDSNKLNADKCKSCNSAPISVECTTMAWTPPNKDTGEYPRISNTGEEENILSYGCLRCASMGKVCSKLGQQLYPLPQINKKQKKTYDGKPLEPLMLSEVVKLPPGYRILFEEPKRPRLLATPSTRQNTEPPASLASSSSKNEQAAAAGALATAAPPPGTESSRASSLKIKIKRSIGTSDTTEDRRPKVSRSILPTPPATASPASYPTADTRACTSTEIAQYPTLRPISEYDLSTDITHSDLAPGTKSIKIPDRAAQARICYRVQRAREAAPHLWPHNAALLGMFRCMPRAGILAKFDYAPMVYQDGSGAKPEPAFPAFLYTHTDFTCSIASFAGKPTILFDWTYPHPDTLQYPNLVNESIVLDPCLHCSTSYEAKKACKVRNLILWGKDKGKKFEYPESMETEDRRGMAKNRGRMRLHSWTDDMVYCRYYIHDHEVRRLKAPAQTDDAPLNPGSHIMAVDPVSAAGPSSDTTPQHELPDRPNVSATSLSRWARQLSVTPPRSRELQPRTIGPVEPLIVMPAAIGISDEERPSPFLDRRPLPSPSLPAEAANLDTDVDMGDDNDGWSDCRIPPSAHATLSQPDDSRLEVKEEPQEGAEELEWGNVRTIPPRPASTATAGEPYHPLETHASLRHATSTRRPSPSAIDNDIKPNIANPDRDDSEDPDVPLSSTFRRDDASALQEQNATLRAEIARLKAKLAHEREQRQQDQDKYEDKLEKVQDELVRERNHTAQLDSKVKGYKSDWRKERDLRLKDRAGADPGLGQMTTSAPGLPLGRSVSRNEHWAGSSSGAGIVDSTSGINAGEETRTVPLEGSGVGGGRGHAPRMIDLTEDDD